jgi:DNA-binding response OmpR family regulator
LLLEKNGQTVSRDEIGQALWSDNQEDYSDWAIDQLIARIRKRLKELSLSPKMVRVVRGKGYILKG